MSEKEKQPVDVPSLTDEELRKLTEKQIQFVLGMNVEKSNPDVVRRVFDALKGKQQAIMEAMISEPYVYISPAIEILPGFSVVFKTIYDFQQDDIWETAASAQDSSKANITASAFLAKMFIVHGIHSINGSPPGGRSIDSKFVKLLETAPKEGKEILENFRQARLADYSKRPPAILNVLHVAYSAFQRKVDDAINFRSTGDDEVDASRAKEIAEAVGKSTGPERAGQPQT